MFKVTMMTNSLVVLTLVLILESVLLHPQTKSRPAILQDLVVLADSEVEVEVGLDLRVLAKKRRAQKDELSKMEIFTKAIQLQLPDIKI